MPSVIVFEGWDAAGKGTSINLLTSRLDPHQHPGPSSRATANGMPR
ncbi:hypothetical protein ACFLYD_08560 [Chloroflexota bacterium]